MPRDRRDGPIVINLTGERAERLARSLLSPRTEQAVDRLWSELTGIAGRGQRIAHDWDPATGRLTLVAGGA